MILKNFVATLFALLAAALLFYGGCATLTAGCTMAVLKGTADSLHKAHATDQVVGAPSEPKNGDTDGVPPSPAAAGATGKSSAASPAGKAAPGAAPSETQSPSQEWADARQAVRQGDVQVRITRVAVDFIQIGNFRGVEQSSSKHLVISLELTNLSPTKIVRFDGWAARLFDLDDKSRARLHDDSGNHYTRVYAGTSDHFIGQVTGSTSVYPNRAIRDLLVFEEPTDTAKLLFLELPAACFGGKGMLRFRIPRDMWEVKPPAPVAPVVNTAPATAEYERAEAARRMQEEARRASEAARRATVEAEKKKQREAEEQARYREWRSEDGTFFAKARFLWEIDGVIHLETPNKKRIQVEKDRLCEEDKAWIDNKRGAKTQR